MYPHVISVFARKLFFAPCQMIFLAGNPKNGGFPAAPRPVLRGARTNCSCSDRCGGRPLVINRHHYTWIYNMCAFLMPVYLDTIYRHGGHV